MRSTHAAAFALSVCAQTSLCSSATPAVHCASQSDGTYLSNRHWQSGAGASRSRTRTTGLRGSIAKCTAASVKHVASTLTAGDGIIMV